MNISLRSIVGGFLILAACGCSDSPSSDDVLRGWSSRCKLAGGVPLLTWADHICLRANLVVPIKEP